MPSGEDDLLQQLLRDRFGLNATELNAYGDIGRAELVAALRTLPAHRPGATASLSTEERHLLDSVGFVEDPEAYAEVVGDLLSHTARLITTAYTAGEVASGLGVSVSAVRDKRLARALWAIEVDGTWVYPVPQFTPGSELAVLPGFEQVFFALPSELHPAVVAGFLLTPQAELIVAGQPTTVQDWLVQGGGVDQVLGLIDISEWLRA